MSITNPGLITNKKWYTYSSLALVAVLTVMGLWFYSASTNSLFSDEAFDLSTVFGLKEVGRPVLWSPYKHDYLYEYSKLDPTHTYPRGLHFNYLAKYWADIFGYQLLSMRIYTLVISLITWVIMLGYLSFRKYISINSKNLPIFFLLFFANIFMFIVSQYFRFYVWYGLFIAVTLILYNEILKCINDRKFLRMGAFIISIILIFCYLDNQHISLSHYIFAPLMILFPFRERIIGWFKARPAVAISLWIASGLVIFVLAAYSLNLFGFNDFLKNHDIVAKIKEFINTNLNIFALGKKEGGTLSVFSLIPRKIYFQQWVYALIGGNIFLYYYFKYLNKLSEFDKFLLFTFIFGTGILAFVQHTKLILIHHSYIFGIVLTFLLIKTWPVFSEGQKMKAFYIWIMINCIGSIVYIMAIFPTTYRLFTYIESHHRPQEVLVLDLAALALIYGNPSYEYVNTNDLQATEESKHINPNIAKFGYGRLVYQYTRPLTPKLLEDLFKASPKPYKYIIIDWFDQRKYQGNDTFLYQFLDANAPYIKKVHVTCRNCQLYKVDLPP